jgi:hypothetical protein
LILLQKKINKNLYFVKRSITLGKHYVPQYYLSGFSNDEVSIYMYEKNKDMKAKAVIKKVASIPDYYSPDFERHLAKEIEKAAHIVLAKIRAKEQISEWEKKVLSEYIVALMKRVPEAWNRFIKMLPGTADSLYNSIVKDIDAAASQHPEKLDFYEIRKQQIKEILADIVSNSEKNKDIWEYSILPETTPLICSAIQEMRWTFLCIEKEINECFLTCDNPVFFFTGMGFNKTDSELSFPISSKIALWATWKPEALPNYVQAPRQFIREINRRTVHNATRFVFYCNDERWVSSFVQKGTWKLNRLHLFVK